MASIKLILRKNQEDKTGHCPLYIRVIKDRKAKFISTGQKLKVSEWDEIRQKIKKNHPNSVRLNAYLSQIVADAEGKVVDFSRKKESVSAKKLKEAIKGKELANFFEYAENRLAKIKGSIAITTHKTYVSNISKFRNFIGEKELFFEDITPVLLNDFMNHCYSVLKNRNHTVHTNIKTLKTIYRDAMREDVVSANLYPFDKIKTKKCSNGVKYLTREEIDLLKNVDLSEHPKHEKIRDMFLFSVYAGGLRLADVVSLQWKHIDFQESKLSKKIRKTGHLHSFKLVFSTLNILEKYRDEDCSDENFVFDLIKNRQKFLENENYAVAEIARISTMIQKSFTFIANKIELGKPLTFHMSRHTFATNALNNGMRIEHVSKIMDHSNINVTQIYAKVINTELDTAMERFVY
ncbi:MAG: site-specific integrase [Flavobacteriaceae bacterium]|jgi:site-specific recombinase XerD|nr:site-specific integrase [Flavobacteriaceae bacterium]